MTEQKQHVDYHRKIRLRRQLLEKAGELTGAFYIPFIGEGDIAVDLYNKNKIYGADIEPLFVSTARSRLPDAEIIIADCDKYPFIDTSATIALADFDAYSYPYDSFRSFFKEAKIGSQCVLFFTDGQRQAIIRTGHYRTPDGEKKHAKTKTEKRAAYNFYFNKIVVPWFKEYIKPWTIVYITKYLRKNSMCYWGAVIESKQESQSQTAQNAQTIKKIKGSKFDETKKELYIKLILEGKGKVMVARELGVNISTVDRHMTSDPDFKKAVSLAQTEVNQKIENALYEAAMSGNTTAIQVWLYNRDPKRWADRRNIQLAGKDGGPIEVEIDAKGKLVGILNRLAARTRTAESEKQQT